MTPQTRLKLRGRPAPRPLRDTRAGRPSVERDSETRGAAAEAWAVSARPRARAASPRRAHGLWALALVAVAAASVDVVSPATLPPTGHAHMPVQRPLLTTLVSIPRGAGALEELAARRLMLGRLHRRFVIRSAIAVSSPLFGAWRVVAVLRRTRAPVPGLIAARGTFAVTGLAHGRRPSGASRRARWRSPSPSWWPTEAHRQGRSSRCRRYRAAGHVLGDRLLAKAVPTAYCRRMDPFPRIAAQRRRICDMAESFSDEQWATASLCGAWTVKDVLAHLLMALETSTATFVVAMARAKGDFARANVALTGKLAARPAADLIAGLRAKADSRFTPPGSDWHAPLTDNYVHAIDIARPLGLDAPADPADVADILAFLLSPAARRGFVPVALPALTVRTADGSFTAGDGPDLTGSPEDLMLALTGRPAGFAGLTGDGAAVLRSALG